MHFSACFVLSPLVVEFCVTAKAYWYKSCSRRGVVVFVVGFRAKGLEFKTLETPLVFVGKGIRNLKCYVAPVQILVRKRVCSGRHTLNRRV